MRRGTLALWGLFAFVLHGCSCQPPPGMDAGCVDCDGQCVDLTTDPDNCGICGRVCMTSRLCRDGNCLQGCGDGGVLCGILCTDIDNDRLHCGDCSTVCPAFQSCSMGRCGCPSGQLYCSSTCVDPLITREHCGGCDRPCSMTQRCALGVCRATSCTHSLLPLGRGALPAAVVAADLDGDGAAEIAVADSDGGFVTVFRAQGNDFAPGSPMQVGRGPVALAVADVDGDGVNDLVTVNRTASTLSVLLSRGGGFSPARDFPTGVEPTKLALGDVNGDSLPDAVTSSPSTQSATVHLNERDGGFRVGVTLPVTMVTSPAGIGNFDRDGGIDLAFIRRSDLAVFVGLPDGGYVLGPVTANVNGESLLVGDFDGLNGLDLGATFEGGFGSLHVLINGGAGSFSVSTMPSGVSVPRSLSTGDLNRDGKADLIVGGNPEHVAVRLGAANGGFGAALTSYVGLSPRATAIADLNRDGIVDLVSALAFSAALAVSFGDGDGTLGGPVHSGPNAGYDPIVTDFDRDGIIDLVMRTVDSVSVMKNDGAGHLTATVLPGIVNVQLFTVLDLDGDTAPDVVTFSAAASALRFYRNERDGGFALVRTQTASLRDLVTADTNGDGRDDVVYSDSLGAVRALVNAGDGGYGPSLIFNPAGSIAEELVAADLNDDGRVDLAATYQMPGNTAGAFVLLNGAAGFMPPQTVATCAVPGVLAVGDLAGDRRPEIALGCANDRMVRVVTNTAAGFGMTRLYEVHEYPTAIAIGDVTRDGMKDVVSSHLLAAEVSVLVGDGDGGVTGLELYGASSRQVGVAVGDFDRDGFGDLAATTGPGAADVFLNTCR